MSLFNNPIVTFKRLTIWLNLYEDKYMCAVYNCISITCIHHMNMKSESTFQDGECALCLPACVTSSNTCHSQPFAVLIMSHTLARLSAPRNNPRVFLSFSIMSTSRCDTWHSAAKALLRCYKAIKVTLKWDLMHWRSNVNQPFSGLSASVQLLQPQ